MSLLFNVNLIKHSKNSKQLAVWTLSLFTKKIYTANRFGVVGFTLLFHSHMELKSRGFTTENKRGCHKAFECVRGKKESLIYSDPPEQHAWECVRFSELKPELPLNHPETKSQNLCVSMCMRERVHLPFSHTLKGLGSPALTQILSYSLITRVRLQPFS